MRRLTQDAPAPEPKMSLDLVQQAVVPLRRLIACAEKACMDKKGVCGKKFPHTDLSLAPSRYRCIELTRQAHMEPLHVLL
ncbi:hypothetical protein EYF80_059541 [Liparis tanakae]|uniref:Uncharacterized protein n=1 Tax=Liparis tanakae TaxID=230148 RepID=A0A4Z2EMZ1_9TELE|nr:hypothetical protein EYF80_059541 [Liparis tanakae]